MLEWPYRRFQKVFDAWQRRNAIDEIETKKNLHINALQGIVEWKEEGDQSDAIENVEKYYELLKDYIWNPKKADKENKEMQELEENDSFLAAGKRNIRIAQPAFPNQESIEEILTD